MDPGLRNLPPETRVDADRQKLVCYMKPSGNLEYDALWQVTLQSQIHIQSILLVLTCLGLTVRVVYAALQRVLGGPCYTPTHPYQPLLQTKEMLLQVRALTKT